MKNVLSFSKQLLKENLSSDAMVVDATVGNGHDTLYLCENYKFVYGFDIQEEAIKRTKNLLKENDMLNFELICDSHENVLSYIDKIDGAIFNLGYLPSYDKSVTTNYKSTINAVKSILDILCERGIIILVIYTGHDDSQEANHIEEYVMNLDKKLSVLKYKFINRENSPYIIAIKKG